MELTSRMYFIYNGNSNNILKMSLERNMTDFIIIFRYYKIRNYDKLILDTVKKKLHTSPFDDDLLTKIDCILEKENIITTIMIDKYCKYLSNILNSVGTDKTKLCSIEIANKYHIHIEINQLEKLYTDVKSINDNLIVLNAIYKMSNPPKKNIENKINNNTNNDIITTNKVEDIVINPQDNNDSIVEKILSYTSSKIVRSSIIHLGLTYFPFINNIVEVENELLKISSTSIIPSTVIFQYEYIFTLICSIQISNDEIKHDSVRLINILYNDLNIRKNNILLSMILYILMINFIKYLFNINQSQFINKYTEWLSNPESQTKIINYYIYNFCPEYKNKLKIIFNNSINYDKINDDLLTELSEKNKHLISIDPEKFIELIFKKTEENNILPEKFIFTSKKIINIKDYENKDKQYISDLNENDFINSLLTYNFNNESITYSYQEFVKYNKDINSILFIDENKIPLSVVKLFEFLKDILKKSIFSEDNINTLNYYIILITKCNDSKSINHTTFLYIIFQIIIPYYYDIYKIKIFEDQLLI